MVELGKAIGILVRAIEREEMLHEDIDAWGAPGECHGVVARGEDRRMRQARKHAEAVAGMPLRVIRRKARKLMGSDAPLYRRYGFVPYR